MRTEYPRSVGAVMRTNISFFTLFLCSMPFFSTKHLFCTQTMMPGEENMELKIVGDKDVATKNNDVDKSTHLDEVNDRNHSSNNNSTVEDNSIVQKKTSMMNPGYNAPAAIDVKHQLGGWDCNLYVDASFLYWFADQEGMDLATSVAEVQTDDLSYVTVFTDRGRLLRQKFEYKPGFAVGFGINSKDWMLDFKYTWVRNNTRVNKNPPSQDQGL